LLLHSGDCRFYLHFAEAEENQRKEDLEHLQDITNIYVKVSNIIQHQTLNCSATTQIRKAAIRFHRVKNWHLQTTLKYLAIKFPTFAI